MKSWVMAGLLIAAGSGAFAADVVNGKTAGRALFSGKGAQATIRPQLFLTEKDVQVLEQVAATQKYYGAIALSPDEGLMSEATFAAANYHDVAPARDAALAACNGKRKKGTAPCVIVGDILPVKWKKGAALQLSTDATGGFEQSYEPAKAPKALAISVRTGHWAIASGSGASEKAVADCAREGATDCRVVVSD